MKATCKFFTCVSIIAATASMSSGCGEREVHAPLIGISTACDDSTMLTSLRRSYTEAVLAAGGIAVALPTVLTEEEAGKVLSRMDGVIFSGGEDVAPRHYGEEELPENGRVSPIRDSCEMLYARAAIKTGMPVLGICRGCQLMNVVLGGSLYQDIPTQHPTSIAHRQTAPEWEPAHMVRLSPDGILHETLTAGRGSAGHGGKRGEAERNDAEGGMVVGVNSFHHQAVKEAAPGLRVTAVAEDGIVEAYENADRSIIGVQFHPEKCIAHGDTLWLPLLRHFVDKCRR